MTHKRRAGTDLIVVHCSATKPHQDIGSDDIRRWHMDPAFPGGPFGDIGYHYVIRRSGAREPGRPDWAVGAHARGHNHHSVGICLVGGIDIAGQPDSNFTRHQLATLHDTLLDLCSRYPGVTILGHRDLPGVTKACPCFNVAAWWGQGASTWTGRSSSSTHEAVWIDGPTDRRGRR